MATKECIEKMSPTKRFAHDQAQKERKKVILRHFACFLPVSIMTGQHVRHMAQPGKREHKREVDTLRRRSEQGKATIFEHAVSEDGHIALLKNSCVSTHMRKFSENSKRKASESASADLQRIIDAQAVTIAEQLRALAECKAEMRAQVQFANDLMAEVRAAALRGAEAVAALLPGVGSFYTRPKDTCSRCHSTDAVKYDDKSRSVVCSTGCLAKRMKSRVMAEPTPLLMTKQATDAKQATFVFLFSRASTLFVPPANLRQRQEVLDNFVEHYFAHFYAVDHSLVFPGAGDVFLVSKLCQAGTCQHPARGLGAGVGDGTWNPGIRVSEADG
jgi:hypothetical protein